MVSPETMNSSIRHHPRPELQPAGCDERAQSRRGFGADGEVVVEDDGLAVEQEPLVRQVALEEVEQLVEQADEADSRNDWNGSYHSRSQCVWGTIATGIGIDWRHRAPHAYVSSAHVLDLHAPRCSSTSTGR